MKNYAANTHRKAWQTVQLECGFEMQFNLPVYFIIICILTFIKISFEKQSAIKSGLNCKYEWNEHSNPV